MADRHGRPQGIADHSTTANEHGRRARQTSTADQDGRPHKNTGNHTSMADQHGRPARASYFHRWRRKYFIRGCICSRMPAARASFLKKRRTREQLQHIFFLRMSAVRASLFENIVAGRILQHAHLGGCLRRNACFCKSRCWWILNLVRMSLAKS